ncbi:TrkH family potassium uptake protein, partial [bacterium]|nr:TrkH family potassium uptake protein [bacterium]
MNVRAVIRVLGFLLGVTSLGLLLPAVASAVAQDGDAWSFLAGAGVGAVLAAAMWWWGASASDIRVREGFAVVTLGWLAVGLLGALPAWFSGQIPTYTDAAFESISGFTTTGASILTDIEAKSHGLLLWRSLSHWLGGMGIVVLALAILPLLGVGGMQLFRAEVPGPVAERLTPRISQTAKLLWGVYVLLTVLEAAALMIAGLSFFDAICHAMATMATGGFSTRNGSVGAYQDPAVDWIVIVFMFLAGVNFALHYLALSGKLTVYSRDDEFRFYGGLTLLSVLLIGVALFAAGTYPAVHDTVRHTVFQVVAIITTTGFGTADYLQWPPVSHAILLLLMAVGGCAGSTGGGIKVMRLLLLLKVGKLELKKLVHPRAVTTLWFNGHAVKPNLATNVLGFFLLFVTVYVIGVIVLTLGGRDLVTAIGATAASLGNIGPGLGSVGPAANYAHLLAWEKWLLVFMMLAG